MVQPIRRIGQIEFDIEKGVFVSWSNFSPLPALWTPEQKAPYMILRQYYPLLFVSDWAIIGRNSPMHRLSIMRHAVAGDGG